MSTTSVTADKVRNCTEYELSQLGRFNTRTLAQELGMFKTEEQKSAFMQLSNEEQANELFRALRRFYPDMKKTAVVDRGKELRKIGHEATRRMELNAIKARHAQELYFLSTTHCQELHDLNDLLQKALRIAKTADADYTEVNTAAQKELKLLRTSLEQSEARSAAYFTNNNELHLLRKQLEVANAKMKRLTAKKKREEKS